ncbi:recombinase family protein [Clostridium baratii]|uniref:recombinase family protein n=1 Tax=Clostridium baratii TaxID=1561 RepID=UPI002A75CAE8|nr:recombinase family protein [Clostridium baratii]MDY3207694.1 recombinase family protein [Clostridium baratii]
MNNLKSVINSSENYAAIYARISSTNDNNSINGQINLAKEVLSKKNLLLYDTYIDHTSARTKAPHQRPGFSKLLRDAKAGCFKILIIYRLDRLVRNFNHWITIKQLLNKLGIQIIYSDESQVSPDDSSYNEFLQNLTVMVAEMEPNTINLRTSEGRKFRRQQGAYNAARTSPFGYIRKSRNVLSENNISKSIFIGEPIKLSFIRYLFLEYNNHIIKEKIDIKNNYIASLEILLDDSRNMLNSIISSLETNSDLITDSISYSKHYIELINSFNPYISSHGLELLMKELKTINFHYFIEKKTGNKKNPGNFNKTLRNPIYAGYMLLDSNHLCKGLKYTSLDGDDDNITYKERIDESAFIKTNNLNGVIPYEIFKTVYSYLAFKDLGKTDRSKDFLFKGKLKCSCNKKILLIDDLHLHCGDSNCNIFYKDDLLRVILSTIVKDVLSKSTNSFNKFTDDISSKIKLFEGNIKYNRLNKFELLENYLNYDDSDILDSLFNKESLITNNLKMCNEYRKRLSYIENLRETFINPTENTMFLQDKIDESIDYILKNEDIFFLLFNELIKEIKVINYGNQNSRKIKIKYEFTPPKVSDIY